MAADVAYRAVTANPVKQGSAVITLDGFGFMATAARDIQLADVDATLVARLGTEGRHRLYYTTGAADPPDGT